MDGFWQLIETMTRDIARGRLIGWPDVEGALPQSHVGAAGTPACHLDNNRSAPSNAWMPTG